MTGKQIKRQFKKYLTDTNIEFTYRERQIKIKHFVFDFPLDDYIIIYTPYKACDVYRIDIFYTTPEETFGKVLYWYQKLYKHGMMIQGRVRTLHPGKRQKFVFR